MKERREFKKGDLILLLVHRRQPQLVSSRELEFVDAVGISAFKLALKCVSLLRCWLEVVFFGFSRDWGYWICKGR